jgi:hypothetical protein
MLHTILGKKSRNLTRSATFEVFTGLVTGRNFTALPFLKKRLFA